VRPQLSAGQAVAARAKSCEAFRMKHASSVLFCAVFAGALIIAAPMGEQLGSGVAEAATPSPRAVAAQQAFKAPEAAFQGGATTAEDVYIWSRRWFEAERGANANAAKDHLARMKTLDAAVQKNVTAGAASRAQSVACAFYVAEAKELVASP
jgi:hypothetical protein